MRWGDSGLASDSWLLLGPHLLVNLLFCERNANARVTNSEIDPEYIPAVSIVAQVRNCQWGI